MTESSTTTDATDAAGTEQQQQTYTPPPTQADLDRIIAARVERTKAQFKDHAELKAKATELDQIKAANQTEAQRQAEELSRLQAQAETWRSVAVGARIEALAATDFADPSDAIKELSGKDYLDESGQVDNAAIQRDLAEVLERKPHWRRDPLRQVRLPGPNSAQGSGERPPALTSDSHMNALIRGARGGQ